jgi:beta-lactamase regulating signal transducer with metallopeptidase domain
MPVTWGCRHPRIVVPLTSAEWSADCRRIVLLHELAHIRRNDWLTLLFAECVRAMHWFNPIVWLALR